MAISLPLGASNSGPNDWSDCYNNDAQLVTEIDARDDNYGTLFTGTGSYAASTSGTRYFANSGALISAPSAGLGALVIYLDDADFTVASKTTKLRIRAQQITSNVGPGVTLTVGLYPVTAVSAGNYTIGAVITGSTVAFASTAANTLAQGNSGDFNVPADGHYIVGVANSGTTAASSTHDLAFQLQVRHT